MSADYDVDVLSLLEKLGCGDSTDEAQAQQAAANQVYTYRRGEGSQS